MCIIYLGKMLKIFTIETAHSKQKTPVHVCLLRVDHGLPRETGKNYT
jgi:hypothetical protein